MMKKTLLALSMGLALSACGADHVETTKNTAIEGLEGETYSSILDNRNVCTDGSWSTVELEDSSTPMVEFRCTLKGGADFMAKELPQVLEAQKESLAGTVESFTSILATAERGLEKSKARLAQAEEAGANRNTIISLKRAVKSNEDRVKRHEERIADMKQDHMKRVEEIKASYDIAAVDEVLRWRVKEDGADLASAELVKVTKAGEEDSREYQTWDEGELFAMFSEGDTKNPDATIDTYLETVMVYDIMN